MFSCNMSKIKITYILLIENKLNEIINIIETITNDKISRASPSNKNKIYSMFQLTCACNKHVEKHGGVLNNCYKSYTNILDKWIQQMDLLFWAIFGTSDNMEYNTIGNKMDFILQKTENIETRFIKMNII
jgi:hypothetical protein